MSIREELTRRKLRYWLFRFRNEAEGGCIVEDAPYGLRVEFQAEKFFDMSGGWAGFCVKWDVEEELPFAMVPTDSDMWQDWEDHCDRVAEATAKTKAPRIELVREPVVEHGSIDVVMTFD
jgi:hypothetical protein